MDIQREQFDDAVERAIIDANQADQLVKYFQQQDTDLNRAAVNAKFDFANLLYYFGGLIAIGAMTLFMTLGFEAYGGAGIFWIALAYAGVGLKLATHFEHQGYVIPAGICATFVVALTPLAIYGVQTWFGFWPDDSSYRQFHSYIQWHWIYMELGTLATGAALARRYKFPFMLMPIAVTLWYLSMDLAVMLADGRYSLALRQLVSLYFGLLMIGLAFWVDIRSRQTPRDFAFWLYIFGVMTFWGGLSLQDSGSELGKLFYFCINFVMMLVGVLLMRRVFVVFGGVGACCYIGYLSYRVFEDSLIFPLVLCALGLGVIYLGLYWQKHEREWTQRLRVLLPVPLRELLVNRT
tara:strand:- start:3438 stop:4487 length:1050 start_codon:yes stop_codon:yes gene_type:complete